MVLSSAVSDYTAIALVKKSLYYFQMTVICIENSNARYSFQENEKC